jgi:hypothetical protein
MCDISKPALQQIFVGGRAIGLGQLYRSGNEFLGARRPQILGNPLSVADVGDG